LDLREWNPDTGMALYGEIKVRVTYVLHAKDTIGLAEGYCIMGISKDIY
jgi:hypothetical protein